MPRVTAPPLPAECPWGGFTPPNLDWCEEQLCGWVVNPADTWSNLLYIALGVLMWRETARRRREGVAMISGLELFGPTSIAVGVFSLAFHASYTYLLQFFDFVGMFLFCFTVITTNALRLGSIGERSKLVFFASGVVGFSVLVPVLSEASAAFPIQGLVGVLIAVILAQEGWIAVREQGQHTGTDRRAFWLALALMAGAGSASAADLSRTWCNPGNHILQGHSIWHLLSASALYALYRFYAGLPASRRSQPRAAASV